VSDPDAGHADSAGCRAVSLLPGGAWAACLLAGAHSGARAEKALQNAASVTDSKAARGHWPLEGSNPSPSAFQAAPATHLLPGAAMNGLRNPCNQSTEVHGDPQRRIDLGAHWRITGEQFRGRSLPSNTQARFTCDADLSELHSAPPVSLTVAHRDRIARNGQITAATTIGRTRRPKAPRGRDCRRTSEVASPRCCRTGQGAWR
jgi:hypothetical protein